MEAQSVNNTTQDYMERLRKRGFRLTNQRRIIIETLLENLGEHLNAHELLERVQEKDSSLGIATVYRTIELLNYLGLLNMINLDEGFSRFEVPDEQMHFHIYCRSCGKVVHLGNEEEKAAIVQQWFREMAFEMLPQTFEMAGICRDCQQQGVLEPPAASGGRGPGRRCRRRGR
ncbi:MAG: Fur family transcriptional regulator [Synergistota bacterium]|nr:Fur family transcriptional regulator [Synergistota bacterium]